MSENKKTGKTGGEPAKKGGNAKKSSPKGGAKKTSSKSGANKSVGKFFRELKSELKKVVWPSKRKVVTNTAAVLAGLVLFGLIIYGFDSGLGFLIGKLVGLGNA